jgi:hypothetical protein
MVRRSWAFGGGAAQMQGFGGNADGKQAEQSRGSGRGEGHQMYLDWL